MTEKENNTKNQKPKTSKWLTVSLTLALLLFIIGRTCSPLLKTSTSLNNPAIFSCLTIIITITTFLLPIPFILGVIGICTIQHRTNIRRSYVLWLFAITISVFAFFTGWLRAWPEIRRYAVLQKCKSRIQEVFRSIQTYSISHNDQYPIPSKWCNLLIEETNLDEQNLSWHYYAMNPHCEPNSPNDVVLLFETKGGWNQYGGPELLTLDNHEGKGCNILFNDGSVKFVKAEDIGELKWKIEEIKDE